jgi:hypothetical protein
MLKVIVTHPDLTLAQHSALRELLEDAGFKVSQVNDGLKLKWSEGHGTHAILVNTPENIKPMSRMEADSYCSVSVGGFSGALVFAMEKTAVGLSKGEILTAKEFVARHTVEVVA